MDRDAEVGRGAHGLLIALVLSAAFWAAMIVIARILIP